MNEKLSLQDLVDLLSKKAKITKKDADSFYRELFQLILERIFDNDLVKIKDFGTFKLVSVSSRESVNVNTGEKIEIPSHYKLSFIPDKVLKSLVNKPFSQFETIMLEDGVVFEASVDNNEDANEDESTENAEVGIQNVNQNIVLKAEEPIEAEAITVDSHIKSEVKKENTPNNETSNVSKPKASTNQAYPRSFVYNYTTSTSEEKSGSITLTVPKNDLIGAVHTSKVEEEISSQDIPQKKEFPIELKDLPIIENDIVNDLSEEIVESIDESIEEEILSKGENETIEDQISIEDETLDEVVNLIPDNEFSLTVSLPEDVIADEIELESDFHSELETEEDVIIPIPIIERIEKKKKTKDSVVDKVQEKESRAVFSNEDPERPLFPIEEDQLIDDLNLTPLSEIEDGKSEVIEAEVDENEPINVRSHAGNNKPTETRSVLFSDTIDPVDIPYTDYNNPEAGSKFKKWLPVILFILVIVGFLTYGLVKMLRKPYDYEYNLGRTNLSLSDTLPLVEEGSPQVHETDALLDSMKKVQSALATDTVKPMKQEPIVPIVQIPAVKQEVESVQSAIVGSADSLTTELIGAEKNGFIISDKLKFGILNKAEYHLSKYADNKGEKVGTSSSALPKVDTKESTTSRPQYATIKKGTTLRTISAAHYGSPDYWVYIYEANKRNIANPNNVPIGTTLFIPSLSDYGVFNPKSSAALQTAKNLESKILGKK